MAVKRPRLIAIAASILAVLVTLVWLFGSTHHDEGDEEDRVTAAVPMLSRSANGNVIVTVSRAERAQSGLKTEPLIAVTRAREVIAYGIIADPAPLAVLDAELIAARATLDASKAEYTRAKLLHSERENVSLKDYQAARAKFLSDQAQFNLLDQRMADEWGNTIATLTPADRSTLVDALIKRTAAIMRVSVPAGRSLANAPARADVTVLGYSRSFAAQSIWPAPSVDPGLQGHGFMIRVDTHGFPLRAGAAVTARLRSRDNAERGVVVPNAAVVRTGDAAWAYVQTASDKFERRRLIMRGLVDSGWFVTSGFNAGDRVVTIGAQSLLSEEFKSQIQVQD